MIVVNLSPDILPYVRISGLDIDFRGWFEGFFDISWIWTTGDEDTNRLYLV